MNWKAMTKPLIMKLLKQAAKDEGTTFGPEASQQLATILQLMATALDDQKPKED